MASISLSIAGLEMPVEFWLPFMLTDADPQYWRCSLPGDTDWASVSTTMS